MLEIIDKLGGGSVLVGILIYGLVHWVIIAPVISERVGMADYMDDCKRAVSSSRAESICRRAIRRAASDTITDWAIHTATLGLASPSGVRNFDTYIEDRLR